MGLIDHFRQKAAAQLQGMLSRDNGRGASRPEHKPDNGNGSANSQAENGERRQKNGRTSHPFEASFIKTEEYGKIRLQLLDPTYKAKKNETTFLTNSPLPKAYIDLTLEDFYAHTFVMGEPGCGKTFYVLSQFMEEFFRSTHLPDGPERDKKKMAALITDPKASLPEKAWNLAQKYGRVDDINIFGPRHLDCRIDLFGDPDESEDMRAMKFRAIINAYDEGQKGSDPFWQNQTVRLFTNIFLLYSRIKAKNPDVAPMNIQLLNLMINDVGKAVNETAVDGAKNSQVQAYNNIHATLQRLRETLTPLQLELPRLSAEISRALPAAKRAQEEAFSRQLEIQKEPKSPAQEARLRQAVEEVSQAAARQANLRGLDAFVAYQAANGQGSSRLPSAMSDLNEKILSFDSLTSDEERQSLHEKVLAQINSMQTHIRDNYRYFSAMGPEWGEVKSLLVTFIDSSSTVTAAYKAMNALGKNVVTPQYGPLTIFLNEYEKMLTEKNINPQMDDIWSFFKNEFLHPENLKVSKSIASTAGIVLSLFLHPPFSHMFSSNPTIDFRRVIDEGKIFVVDMPTGFYGPVAMIALIAVKIECFHAMLSREYIRIPDGKGGKRQINQQRPFFYIGDECASSVTTGQFTGEIGTMDKSRQYKCGFMLATQNIPLMHTRISEKETSALVGLTSLKICMRNTDPDSCKFASSLFGEKDQVRGTQTRNPMEILLNPDRKAGESEFTFSVSRGPRYDSGVFAALRDGQCCLRLHPRFGRNQFRRTQLLGHIIDPPTQNPWPMPICETPPAEPDQTPMGEVKAI